MIGPIQARSAELKQRPTEVIDALESGGRRCRETAKETMEEVRDVMGIGRPALGTVVK